MSDGLFAALRCEPEIASPDLVAVDACDRLILDESAATLATADPSSVTVIGDRYGALTLGVAQRFGVRGLRVHSDRLTGELALAANAERLGYAEAYRAFDLVPELVSGARVVLLRLPRSLDALDEIAGLVAQHADPGVVVVAGGRDKHMSHAMNEVLARHFGSVRASRGRQKSRVLHASGPHADSGSVWPVRVRHEDIGLTVCAHGAAFAGARVDLGTRFLVEHLGGAAPTARLAIDLGCGTGVLACALAVARRPGAGPDGGQAPRLRVIATDESSAAVASARATVEANGVSDLVRVQRAVGTDGIEAGSVDLVVLNPPFHIGSVVDSGVARELFAAAARVLRPGGELWCVWNSALRYRPSLQAIVGPTRQIARNSKFTVTASVRG